MRVLLRRDVPVATLIFDSFYPDVKASQEVVRMFTPIEHLRRIVAVLAQNLDAYEAEMAKVEKPTRKGLPN